MSASIVAKALPDIARYFEALPDVTLDAAVLAINDTANQSLPSMSRKMRAQIAFPAGYLSAERFGIRRKASRATLEAIISGRDRPTSLARFASGATPENSRGRKIFVKVKPGQTQTLDKAFLVRLKNNNIGLAVRLRPGQRLRNSEKAVRLENNVYLLYGPSVDQVLQDVSAQELPLIADRGGKNFLRQFARLTRG